MDRIKENLENLCLDSLKILLILKCVKKISKEEFDEHVNLKLSFLNTKDKLSK